MISNVRTTLETPSRRPQLTRRIVPSTSLTQKKTGAVLRAFGAYLLGCSDRYQLVASENSAGIACEVVEQLATGAIQAAAAGPQDEAT